MTKWSVLLLTIALSSACARRTPSGESASADQASGGETVNQDGEPVVCRRERQGDSHKRKTVCRSDEERRRERQDAQRRLGQGGINLQPPETGGMY